MSTGEERGRIAEYLKWCERRELRPRYVAAVQQTLQRVETQIGAPLSKARADDLEGWWDGLTCGAGSRCAYGSHVTGFFRWLMRERIREDDPTARLVRPRLRRRLPRPISDERLRDAVTHAQEPVRTWLLLAAYMGFRACEVATLRHEDVSGDLAVIIVRGKGDKERILPIHPVIAAALGPDTGARGYLFKSRRGRLEHVSANSVSKRANDYLRTVGITDTFHSLRHWFGTSTYRQSQDLRLVQELMGHSAPSTTAGYAAWAPERAARVVQCLSFEESTLDDLPELHAPPGDEAA